MLGKKLKTYFFLGFTRFEKVKFSKFYTCFDKTQLFVGQNSLQLPYMGCVSFAVKFHPEDLGCDLNILNVIHNLFEFCFVDRNAYTEMKA